MFGQVIKIFSAILVCKYNLALSLISRCLGMALTYGHDQCLFCVTFVASRPTQGTRLVWDVDTI
ncbi:unnamed protein product [Spodoptera exigua]|nr:unnamed protein product [Spodoptera exigua]